MCRKEIKQEESTFFIKYSLSGKVEKKEKVTETINNLVKQIIEEKQLDEKLIRDLAIHYIRGNQEVSIEVDYYKFNPEELKALPIEEQITSVLLKMGYAERDIRNIEYKEFWKNSGEKDWVAKVYNADYSNALREHDSQKKDAIFVASMHIARKALGFRLYFEFARH